MSSSNTLDQKITLLQSTEKVLPLIIIVHDLSDGHVYYMSRRGLDILGVSLREIVQLGPEYHSRFFNPEDNKEYMPKIFSLLGADHTDELVSYFQQVRPGPNYDWRWYLTSSMVFHRDKQGKPSHILSTAIPVDGQHHITAKAERLLEENNFLRQHYHLFHSLTKREKEILRMMAMGCSSSEIGKKLHISSTTASTHRKNIKKKLQAKNNYDLMRYAQAFDLV